MRNHTIYVRAVLFRHRRSDDDHAMIIINIIIVSLSRRHRREATCARASVTATGAGRRHYRDETRTTKFHCLPYKTHTEQEETRPDGAWWQWRRAIYLYLAGTLRSSGV